MIKSFQGVVNNPLAKFVLTRTFDYCEKDNANRLDVGLELLFGKREKACMRCRTTSKILSFIIKKGIKSFGTTEKELQEIMNEPYWIKGLSSVVKGLGQFGVQKPFVPGAPFQIVWNITRACNLKCAHCYEDAGKKSLNELSKKEILNGLDTISRAGVTSVAFSGGEPTTNLHIIEYIKHTKELGMYPALATNGYKLADEKIINKFVDAGLEFVQISIDGLNPKTHDSFRGVEGSWDKAIQAIKNSVKADLFVEVATTVTNHNINEIPEIIDLARNIGAHWFMIYNFIPTGNGTNISEMDISPQDRFNMLKTAYKENLKSDMHVLSTAPQFAMVAESLQSTESSIIPTHFYNPEYENSKVMQLAEFIGGCGAGRFYMSIEPNGDLYPCVFFPHEEELKLGNLLHDDFEEVWKNNPLLKNLRNKDLLENNCGTCESKNVCGGCRARAYTYFNDIQAPDPGCIRNITKWNELKNKIPNYQEIQNGNLLINLTAKNGD
jgi:radical SAM protein with 4Fe4S-binding SPASM domain